MPYRPDSLPQAHGRPFITDGGLETSLIFHDGVDLPHNAAFPLVLSESGRSILARYFAPYLDEARARGVGFVLDTPTWRANPDWAARLGLTPGELREANLLAGAFAAALREREAGTGAPIVLNGVLGPRGDGYVVEDALTIREAALYHGPQMEAFREGGSTWRARSP